VAWQKNLDLILPFRSPIPSGVFASVTPTFAFNFKIRFSIWSQPFANSEPGKEAKGMTKEFIPCSY